MCMWKKWLTKKQGKLILIRWVIMIFALYGISISKADNLPTNSSDLQRVLAVANNTASATKIPPTIAAPRQANAISVSTQMASTQNTAGSNAQTELWNFQNADIRAVIAAVARETGKNFIVDPQVQGKITVVFKKPLTPSGIYQVFLSSLQVLGYTAVPSGNAVKIVPSSSARTLGTTIATLTNPGEGDEPVVRVINVKNVSAPQLVPILRPLLPETATISAYQPTNSLVLAGGAASVNRIVRIVYNLENRGNAVTQVVPLRFADANQLLNVLNSLQASDRAAGKITNLAFAADKQTNSVVVSGDIAKVGEAEDLIAQLDSNAAGAEGNTRVFYLNYLKSKDFAPILAKIATGESTSEGGGGAAAAAAGGANPSLNKQISIQGEPDSNAVIITAPPAVMASLRNVIAQLDVRPEQVLVEAVIAQVNETQLRDLGVLWGSVAAVNTSPDAVSPTAVGSGAISSTSFQLGVGFIQSGNIQAIVNALGTNNSNDILSTPSVVVLDNQEAKIEVGKTISIENRIYGTTAPNTPDSNSLVPFTTLERKNVSLQLKVKPQISPNQTVNLTIEQINDTLANPNTPGTAPVVNTSDIKTSVMVKSGDILVLGGLISHELSDTVTKIPLLGDIPVVGRLFQFNEKRMEKKNLVIFLQPVILIPHSAKEKEIVKTKYNHIRQQEFVHYNGNSLFQDPDHDAPVLPPYETKLPVPPGQRKKLPPPFHY